MDGQSWSENMGCLMTALVVVGVVIGIVIWNVIAFIFRHLTLAWV